MNREAPKLKTEIKKGKFLGRGEEKEVYEDPDNPHFAKGIFHEYKEESLEFIKSRFYLTKIMHLLFLKNIPDIHLAASKPHMIIVDRMEAPGGWRSWIKSDDSLEKFEDTQELIEKLENFEVYTDSAEFNFEYDKDGNICYVDSFVPWYVNKDGLIIPNYNPEKLEKALQELEGDKKEQGLSYLNRLKELSKTVGTK